MRTLTQDTIDALTRWSRHHAAMFIADRQDGPAITRAGIDGQPVQLRKWSRDWIILQFYNFTFKDEFEFVVDDFKQHLGATALAEFEARLAPLPPRSDDTFRQLLDEKRPAGYEPRDAKGS